MRELLSAQEKTAPLLSQATEVIKEPGATAAGLPHTLGTEAEAAYRTSKAGAG